MAFHILSKTLKLDALNVHNTLAACCYNVLCRGSFQQPCLAHLAHLLNNKLLSGMCMLSVGIPQSFPDVRIYVSEAVVTSQLCLRYLQNVAHMPDVGIIP